MPEYIVLYHDPLRLGPEQSRTHIAAQSVWVCRDDRYAFEVQVFAPRADPATDFTPASCGEAAYRLALAQFGANAARRAAYEDPWRRDVVVVECSSADVMDLVLDVQARRTVNFGDVIDRFTVATELPAGDQPVALAG